ncbi:MAG: DUF3006 domain-containing protein [Spirochaetes bacterium]|nr:DUF3006 domain-containing protein [Spirochaetota bacterium]
MRAVIDRCEGKIAVLEVEGKFFMEIPKKFLPKGSKDGDYLKIEIEIDVAARKKQISRIKKLQEKLLRRK